jgi:hypothetical protein
LLCLSLLVPKAGCTTRACDFVTIGRKFLKSTTITKEAGGTRYESGETVSVQSKHTCKREKKQYVRITTCAFHLVHKFNLLDVHLLKFANKSNEVGTTPLKAFLSNVNTTRFR